VAKGSGGGEGGDQSGDVEVVLKAKYTTKMKGGEGDKDTPDDGDQADHDDKETEECISENPKSPGPLASHVAGVEMHCT